MNEEWSWESELPTNCQVCGEPFGEYFIDEKLAMHGCWALMCEQCHYKNGSGLGVGKGQKYLTKTREGVYGFE